MSRRAAPGVGVAAPAAHGNGTAAGAPIDVLFVLPADSLALDWAGPAEALRIANQRLEALGRPARFRLRFVGPAAEAQTSVGVRLSGLEPLPAVFPCPTWVVLVGLPGAGLRLEDPGIAAVLEWLRLLRPAAGRLELLTICAGALLAAHAGLLAGRQATTHHHHLDDLRRLEPRCAVVDNRVFVAEPPLYSSAGVTTGIDLALHRIGAVCGEAIAASVAQTMVVALRRGPHDPELSPFLAYRRHLHPALHRVQDAVSQRPQEDWTAERMAEVACTSARHLSRLFMEHAEIAPLQYLRRLRLATADAALRSGASVAQAAERAGFGSDTQLRRAWQQFGKPGTPSRTRLH